MKDHREERVLFREGTLQALAELNALYNCDLQTFNAKGFKSLFDLWKEISRQEVIAKFELGKRPVRIARSTRTLFLDKHREWCLLEMRRRYEKKYLEPTLTTPKLQKQKFIDSKNKDWTFSETCLKGEDAYDTVIRGAKEELKIDIPRDELKKISINEMSSLRESRVYYGWDSLVFTQNFIWETDRYFPNRLPVVKDESTYIYIDKISPIPKRVEDWMRNSFSQMA